MRNYTCFYSRQAIVVRAHNVTEAQFKASALLGLPNTRTHLIAVRRGELTQ